MLFCPWIAILEADLFYNSKCARKINNFYAINYPEFQTNSKIFWNARYNTFSWKENEQVYL